MPASIWTHHRGRPSANPYKQNRLFVMTYNFDPDRWYENERRALDALLRQGQIDEDAYAASLDDLEQRYERMIKRLDGTYQIE